MLADYKSDKNHTFFSTCELAHNLNSLVFVFCEITHRFDFG